MTIKNIQPWLMIGYAIVVICIIVWWVNAQFFKDSSSEQLTGDTQNVSMRSSVDEQITAYESRLITQPDHVPTMLVLASSYMQKVRETADVSFYNNVNDLTSRARLIEPNNPDIYGLEGEIALGRHNFEDALKLSEKAIGLNPAKALFYGIKADALTELGRNDEAIEVLQEMVDIRPDYSSYSRIAYARELNGDIPGAIEALEIAIQAGSTFPENIAFGYTELGKLDFRSDVTLAAKQFNKALLVIKDYPPALEGLGKVAFAQSNYNQAIEFFQKAFDFLPIAQYATDLGDVYFITGDKTKASQYYTLAKIAFDKSETAGVNSDMERAQFLAEHDLDLEQALELAKRSYAIRPSIYGADTLAWALYKNGDSKGAEQYSKQALRLGEHDPLIVYHAGVIAKANGQIQESERLLAKAKQLNPHFSILYNN